MFCSKCGSEIEDGAIFCGNCGAPVEQTNNQEMHCSNCGSKIEEGTLFCRNCGTPVAPVSSQNAAPVINQNIAHGKSMSKAPLIIGICSVVLALILGCAGIMGVVTSRSSKEADSVNSKEEDVKDSKKEDKKQEVKVTKKLEEEYIERMEAYQEYYNQEKSKDDYEIGIFISLDNNKLPLLWMCYGTDENPDNTVNTQLLSYEKGKVEVLAEIRNQCVCPFVLDDVIGAVEWGEKNFYLYDDQEQSFTKISLDNDSHNDRIKQISEYATLYDYYFCKNESKNEFSYLGKKILKADDEISSASEQVSAAPAASEEGSEQAYQKPEDEVSYIEPVYKDADSVAPNEIFYYADGTTDKLGQAGYYLSIMSNIESYECITEWTGGFEADAFLRQLIDEPVYSMEEIYTIFFATGYGYTLTTINPKDYVFKQASESLIEQFVENYIFYGEFDARYIEENLYKALDSEPYVMLRGKCDDDRDWDVDEYVIDGTMMTFILDNGNEYQFQIEFNEAGDKISKISYIDPYASLPEWKQVYLNKLDMSRVWDPSLVDINSDGIPEIVARFDENGGSSWLMYYIDNSNNIQELYTESCGSINYNDNKVYVVGGRTGIYYDRVYSYDMSTGVYDIILDGEWSDEEAATSEGYDETKVNYQIDGTSVSGDEYRKRVEEATTDITNSFYPSAENIPIDTDVTTLIMNY